MSFVSKDAHDNEGLIRAINEHRAGRHIVFAVLEKKKPPDDKLAKWFSHMAQFCVMAREIHSLPDNLRLYERPKEDRREKQAKLIERVRDQEKANGELYNRLASRICRRMVEPSRELTPALRKMKFIFDQRDYDDQEALNYSLGAFLALDVMTDHHIIPGQIKCFVGSGHYGVALGDPDIEYLNKHLREYEHASRHDMKLKSADLIVTETPSSYAYVNKGMQEFLDTLVLFYSELTELVA